MIKNHKRNKERKTFMLREQMHAGLTKLSDCWWAVRPSRLTYCRWQKSGSCPETPRWGQNQGQGSVVCVCVCACVCIWVDHISLHLQVLACTYTHKAPAPSVSDMGELNDRGRKAKEKAFSSCLSFPPSLHFSSLPSLSFLTALSNINAPYGAFWTGFFF